MNTGSLLQRPVGRALALALVGLTVFAACGSDDDAGGDAGGGPVAGTTWTLTELDGEPVPDGVTVDLTFDGERISGSSGCNQYTTAATFDDGEVTVDPVIAGTMMACEPPASDMESAYLAVLGEVSGYSVEDSTLTLVDADDTTRAVFSG